MATIKTISTKLYEWTSHTVPPQAKYCTNASDPLPTMGMTDRDNMGSFRIEPCRSSDDCDIPLDEIGKVWFALHAMTLLARDELLGLVGKPGPVTARWDR